MGGDGCLFSERRGGSHLKDDMLNLPPYTEGGGGEAILLKLKFESIISLSKVKFPNYSTSGTDYAFQSVSLRKIKH